MRIAEFKQMRVRPIISAVVLSCFLSVQLPAQNLNGIEGLTPESVGTSDVPLEGAPRAEFESAVRAKDYKRAEALLVDESQRDPKSPRAAKLLAIAGGIFFLDGEYSNSVIAWKKSEAIVPLDEHSRFTLAMAEIHLNRPDWARTELERLAAAQARNSLYVYWLGRLDYDAGKYATAIQHFQKAIELDPQMMRPYYNLGLCHDYLGRVDEAIADYEHAISLNRTQPHPSPWPYLDFAIALMEKNRFSDAEKNLREAISYDPKLPQSHYQLGRVLDAMNREPEALTALKQAATLDSNYPDPHYLLGRIYQRMGENQLAKIEADRFQILKKDSASPLNSQPRNMQP